MGVAPVSPTGAFQVGIDQGFFKAEGIDLQIQKLQGGSAAVPGVMSESPQFATSGLPTLLLARDQGLGIKIASAWSGDHVPPANGLYGVVVPNASPIKTLKDLEGHSVAVNTLKGLGDFTVEYAAKKAGADPTKLKLVELAFPDMSAALDGGSVDAAWFPEPFLSKNLADGKHRLVSYTTQKSLPGLKAYVFTSERLTKENPKLVAAMTRALNKTIEYAEKHTEEVQVAAATITGLPVETVKASPMETFETDLDKPTITEAAAAMQKLGWIKNAGTAAKGLLP
jgi:NitT/TauT family transport system substrate-binding protein